MPRPKKTETTTTKKPTKGTSENIVNKALASIYEKRMDMMERKFNLTSSELSIPDRMSSGMLMIDYILGGGYVTGTMVQVSGIEKGGKSTLCMTTLGSAINVKVPIIQYWDAENALNDPRYAEAIVRRDIGKLFYGPARAGRLYQESVLEDFYNGTKFIMRSLPDKLYRSDRKAWYFVFDSDKAGRANMEAFGFGKLAYDKDLFRDTNRLWCPTDMAGMQGMIFCDSYPALVTADEDESDEDKNAMALNARAFSKNIRKIVGIMKRKGFIVMGVNQIRQKPGFNMGCVHGDTIVPFVDGSSATIKNIVDHKLEGEVWSYNEKRGFIEPKPIVNWFYNGEVETKDEWISIKTKAIDTKNGVIGFTVTPDHKLLTKRGWKKAKNLKIKDKLVTKYNSVINDTLQDFLYGTLLGDSTIVIDGVDKGHLRFRDSNNAEYAKWKCDMLSPAFEFKEWKHGIWASNRSYELAKIKRLILDRDPTKILNKLSVISLAIHYMDDGHKKEHRLQNIPVISFKRFKNNQKYWKPYLVCIQILASKILFGLTVL